MHVSQLCMFPCSSSTVEGHEAIHIFQDQSDRPALMVNSTQEEQLVSDFLAEHVEKNKKTVLH